MKILALGATGAIGSQLAVMLTESGHDLSITSRQARPSTNGVTYIKGDAQNDIFLKGLMRDSWDVIVDFMVYDTEAFRRRVHLFLGGVTQQYVFISTARVFSDSESPLTEQSPRLLDTCEDKRYLATTEYALSKARQEDLLRSSGKKNWTIIRPYITFGEGRLQLGTLEKECWLYRALQGRSIVFCDPLMEKLTTLTDSADVASMMGVLLGHSAALGEDYNLTGARTVTWGEVLSVYLDELEAKIGRRPRVLLQELNEFYEGASSIPQLIYDRMYNRRFDPSKIGEIFDMSTVVDPLDALRTRLCSQLANRNGFRAVDWRGEALRDRALPEHARLNEITGLKPTLRYLGYRHIPLNMIKRMKK